MPLPHRRLAAVFLAALLPAASLAQAPRALTLVEEMRIDANAENLSSINWVAISPHGVIAVEQPQDHQFVFFDSKGKRLGTFGREGAGPGEFRQMANIGWVGDTLWVNDFGVVRTTYISPDRKLLRTVMPTRVVASSRGDTVAIGDVFGFFPQAVYPDGSFISIWATERHESHPTWYPLKASGEPLVTMTAAGVLRRIVGYRPDYEQCSVRFADGSTMSKPFCATPVTVIAPSGNRVAIITQENPTSPVATFNIVMLTSRGDTAWARSYTTAATRLARTYRDSVTRVRKARMPDEMRTALDRMPMPDWLAPVRMAVLGDDGALAVIIQEAPESPNRRYLLLDAGGNEVGTLELPKSVQPQAVGRDRMLAIVSDSVGLESVVGYRLVSAGAGDQGHIH